MIDPSWMARAPYASDVRMMYRRLLCIGIQSCSVASKHVDVPAFPHVSDDWSASRTNPQNCALIATRADNMSPSDITAYAMLSYATANTVGDIITKSCNVVNIRQLTAVFQPTNTVTLEMNNYAVELYYCVRWYVLVVSMWASIHEFL